MMLVYRVSHPDDDLVVDVDSVVAIEGVVRSAKPGRYHVDEISSDPLPSGHTSRRWGVVINHADGTVTMDPDPWPTVTLYFTSAGGVEFVIVPNVKLIRSPMFSLVFGTSCLSNGENKYASRHLERSRSGESVSG